MSEPDEQPKVEVSDNLLEFQRLAVSGNRFREVFVTIRVALIVVCVLGSVGMIVWGIVKIVDKPAWLELLLVVLGPSGAVVVGLKFIAWKSQRAVQKLQNSVPQEKAVIGNKDKGKD